MYMLRGLGCVWFINLPWALEFQVSVFFWFSLLNRYYIICYVEYLEKSLAVGVHLGNSESDEALKLL